MKSLVLHDYFESLEGGGRLSSLLARELPADLAYGFAKQNHPFIAQVGQNSHATQLHDLQCFSRVPLWRQFKLARAFAGNTAFLKDYDCAIYSGFYTPLAVHHANGRNILYCHTPPRFIYDQREFYLNQLSPPLRPLLQAFIRYLQPRYEAAVAQMDAIVTNSVNVQQRIQQYLQCDAQVVYPPCATEQFYWQEQGDYYLSTARLDPLKRVDLLVQAFLQMPDKRLIIASGGSELQRLQHLAGAARNIEFTGWLSDVELQQLLSQAIATLYVAKDEDFGMSPVESMAAGKPVIAAAEGGLLESVIANKTGLLVNIESANPDLSIQRICQAVQTMTPAYALGLRDACEARAEQFDLSHFMQQMRAIIDSI